jgi:diguanylate cyclase (GGDEF)-like protein
MLQSIRALVVEDDPAYAGLLRETLADACGEGAAIQCATRLSSALAVLMAAPHDLVLLDLGLPDSRGLDTVVALRNEAPDVPVVVVTSLPDEGLAISALQAGAQDYLIKDEIDTRVLKRAIRYALERHRLQQQLLSLSLIDELTGLNNRRGFFTLAERHLKLSWRRGHAVVLALADVDRLKQINDSFGHLEGDRALIEAARILIATFRDVDIVSRLGGDEFAILVLDADAHVAETLASRLKMRLYGRNAQRDLPYDLSLSLGMVRHQLKGNRRPPTLEELIARADEELYREKRGRAGSDEPAAGGAGTTQGTA